MGLPPLEYLECYLDSPTFRENIAIYEKELKSNSEGLKALLKECQRMIQATEEYSNAQKSFAAAVGKFSFETEGSEKSEDEQLLVESLQKFSDTLQIIEESRAALITTMTHRLVRNLEAFRKDNIQECKEARKKYEKASEKYYQSLEKILSQGSRKGDRVVEDEMPVKEYGAFQQTAFQYVCLMQDIHSQKQYELMEPIIGYFSDITTFFHQAYDTTSSLKPFVDRVQHKVQLLRDVYLEGTKKRYDLKTQVLTKAQEMLSQHPDYKIQGHLMVHERRIGIGVLAQSSWVRYFAQFKKRPQESGLLRLISVDGKGQFCKDFMLVKSCIRSKHDEVDRKFCMEIELIPNQSEGTTKKVVVQAISNNDRGKWMDAMEGKEPVYAVMPTRSDKSGVLTLAAVNGIKKFIDIVEERGLDEEGVYRKPGQVNRAIKLMKDAIGKQFPPNLDDPNEWDIHIICSAIKYYFSKQLSEPLLTFDLHNSFIEAAKVNDEGKRRESIKDLIVSLPTLNQEVLKLLVNHLAKVSSHSDKNFMKPSNLAVCFGPTLMRPERETVATIIDLKHQNKVVEVLIDHVDEMFEGIRDPSEQSSPAILKKTGTSSSLPSGDELPLQRAGSLQQSPQFSKKKTPEGGDVTRMPSYPPPSRPPPPPPDGPKGKRGSLTEGNSAANGPGKVSKKPPILQAKPRTSTGSFNISRENKLQEKSATEQNLPETKDNKAHYSNSNSEELLKEASVPGEDERFKEMWKSEGKKAKAVFDCTSDDPAELTFRKGDVLLNVVQTEEDGWYQANLVNGESGLVPYNYIEFLPDKLN